MNARAASVAWLSSGEECRGERGRANTRVLPASNPPPPGFSDSDHPDGRESILREFGLRFPNDS